MSQLESYIRKYGEVAGPKLYHAVRSRSAYIGVNNRRRATIARLTAASASSRRPGAHPSREAALLPLGFEDN